MIRFVPAVLLLALAAVPASAQAPPAGGPAPTPITTLVGQVTALFPKVEGDVLKVEGSQVTLSVGQRDGVVAGVELVVVHEGDELKHPKTGEVLGRKEDVVGRVSVEQVAEAYSVARITSSKGAGIAPGDRARVSAGKVRLTVLPLSSGIRDNLIEAAVQEIGDYFFGVAGTGFGSMNGFLVGSTLAAPVGADETFFSLMTFLHVTHLLLVVPQRNPFHQRVSHQQTNEIHIVLASQNRAALPEK